MIDHIDFARVGQRIKRNWDPYENNPHMGFLAPSRSGKSYLIRHGILPIAQHARTVLIDVKQGGERTWEGWGNDVTSISPGFGVGPNGTANYRVMLESGPVQKIKSQVSRVLEIVSHDGECILIIDDSRKVTSDKPGLGFSDEIDEILTIGAGTGITAILAANSTVWATSSLRDQCGIYFLGKMLNLKQAKDFAAIAGISSKDEIAELQSLGRRDFLYVDMYDDDKVMAITGLAEKTA